MEIKNVLCPIDFSALSQRELDLAVRVAERFDAHLILEHNFDPRPPEYLTVRWMWSEVHEGEESEHDRRVRREQAAESRLRELVNRLSGTVHAEARLTRGPIDTGLLYLARDLPADLIVIGSHGWSTPDHSSLSEEIIFRAPCPVLTLTEHSRGPSVFEPEGSDEPAVRRVIIPVDFNRSGREAVRQGLELADSMHLPVSLLHLDPQLAAARSGAHRSSLVKTDTARLEELIPEGTEADVACLAPTGSTADGIMNYACRHQAGLIVMGAHRRGILSGLFSRSAAPAVLHESPCPVWFVATAASGRRTKVEVTC